MKKYQIIIGILILSALALYVPLGDMTMSARTGLAVLIFTGGLWVTEAIPLQVTGLLIPVALVASGLMSAENALQPFAAPVVFLILGTLFIAEALRKHGLTRKIAVDLLIRCKGNPNLILLSVMVVAAFTSMWVFSTAVVAMLIPVCLSIATSVEEEKRSQFVKVLLMALVIASTLGGLSTILGASSNAIASGVLDREASWTFIDWMKYGVPLSFSTVFVAWLVLVKTVYPDLKPIKVSHLRRDSTVDGKMTEKQKFTLYLLGGAIFLWTNAPWMESYFNIPDDLMHSAIIGLVVAGILFAAEIINWKDARKINWGVYLIIGGGLALGRGMYESGLTDWFAYFIVTVISNLPYSLTVTIIVIASAFASNTVNNTTVVAILAPLMMDISTGLNVSPVQIMLPMAFGATFGFLLPCASSRTALIYATGEITSKEMFKIGAIITPPLAAMTIVYFYLLYTMGWL